MAERSIIVQPGQCLEDIALQEYGAIEAVDRIVWGNPDVFGDGFSTVLQPGTELALPGDVVDRAMYDTMRKLRIIPATLLSNDDAMLPPGDFNEDFSDDFNNQ